MLSLIGQVAGDPISGGAGWVGAGLLGLVLGWLLLKHLPSKDAQIKEFVSQMTTLIAVKDGQIQEQRKEFLMTLGTMMSAFRAEASAERAACERHFGTLSESVNAAFKTLGDQLSSHSMRNQQWLEVLKREIETRSDKE